MPNAISPFYAVTEQYLDAVEKGQRVVLDLVEKSLGRINDLTPEQLSAIVAKVTPTSADVDRGYALVNRAFTLQQEFSRELAKAFVGSDQPAAPSKPKRAA